MSLSLIIFLSPFPKHPKTPNTNILSINHCDPDPELCSPDVKLLLVKPAGNVLNPVNPGNPPNPGNPLNPPKPPCPESVVVVVVVVEP